MTTPDRPEEAGRPAQPEGRVQARRNWTAAAVLAVVILVPIGILIFSNLDATEVSWAGFRFNQPLWVILFATFAAGMVSGKILGWAWRRWRRRRKELKAELDVLRKHSTDTG